MADEARIVQYRLGDVFVVGRPPTVTYSPREPKKLETILADYLEERGRVLIVTGPSKSGKTVLLSRAIPDAIWVAGGNVDNVDRFWRRVVDDTDSYTTELLEESTSGTETETDTDEAGFMPAGVGAKKTWVDTRIEGTGTRRTQEADRDVQSVGRDALLTADRPLIVDDFHHIAPDVQRELVRHLKPLIDRNVAVIFAAVPHHAADVVAAEGEMEGRVENLQIGLWEVEELTDIADRGYRAALRVRCSEELAISLAEYSLRSPHLMQLLCRELAKVNDIRETAEDDRTRVEPPDDWETFLRQVAERHTHDGTLRTLAHGPQSGSDRIPRELQRGGETDIYGAILEAIAATGPQEQLHYTDLREALRGVLRTIPQKHEVTACLRHMTNIAKELARDEWGRLNRDPVLEYIAGNDTLYIADPFFAFRLRWGPAPS